ncbi:DUF6881 domain-containing protein [Streptomyces sp. NRRL B-24484]|uniref:DUF6881 domain-containing protein n=1 Tax=Streptomyces sp. NRRL B-24484 TaxID=1463833 RepID=UPI0013315175|nr:hypothetical protein [Streptomyces sp. NRRL B-24484]
MFLDDAPGDEPWEVLSEISAEGFETRKIVHWLDGRRVKVGAGRTHAGIALEREPFRTVAEWEQLYVSVEELSEDLFEEMWAYGD